MKEDKEKDEISSEKKLDEVIRQKKAESDALLKLFASLENSEKEKSEKKHK